MQQAWEQAWDNAQPRLASNQRLSLQIPYQVPRIIRVGQLDSELLDQGLVLLLQEPLNKALALVNVGEWLYTLPCRYMY